MITDVEARRIASEWHSGGGSALYVLASSGAIGFDVDYGYSPTAREVESEIDIQNQEVGGDTHELVALLRYVNKRGPRGPVEGWGQLSW